MYGYMFVCIYVYVRRDVAACRFECVWCCFAVVCDGVLWYGMVLCGGVVSFVVLGCGVVWRVVGRYVLCVQC